MISTPVLNEWDVEDEILNLPPLVINLKPSSLLYHRIVVLSVSVTLQKIRTVEPVLTVALVWSKVLITTSPGRGVGIRVGKICGGATWDHKTQQS